MLYFFFPQKKHLLSPAHSSRPFPKHGPTPVSDLHTDSPQTNSSSEKWVVMKKKGNQCN